MSNNSFAQEAQGILSIGYLYLIFMGILNETIYYNQLGIEILSYSSILDVLISPISKLNSSIGVGFIIFILFAIFFFPSYLTKKKEEEWVKKAFKLDANLDDKETQQGIFKFFVFLASIMIFGFFIGTGVGRGEKLTKKIQEKTIEYKDKLTFINGTSEEVELVGKNSAYIFYLTPGSKIVKVTPINGIIKSMEESPEPSD